MRCLIDAQLPPGLCDWLREQGAEAQHVSDVLGGQTPDARINMRLPADLLAAVKARAAREHIPYQRLIRRAIEAAAADLASAATAGRSGQEAGGDRTQPACPELVEG